MSSLVALLHHAIYVCLLGFLLTLIMLPHIGAQQPSLPPGPDPNPGRSQWMIWVVITLMALFTTIYSIFLARCSPAVAADGGGFSWPVWAGRMMMARGLDAAVIDTFPMLVYADVKGMKLGKGALECVVCLSEFKDHETLRLIPKCDHVFHPDCIDEWFAFQSTCPVCRAELAPQSGESPRAIIPAVSMTQATESSIQDNRTGNVERGQDEQEPPSVNNTPNQSRRCEPVSFRTCRFPRSHSTGHSLIQPGEDTERFTLRLPVEVRKQVMDCAVSMAASSRRGNRTGGEGSSRGRYLRRPQVQDWAFRPERWVFSRLPSFFRSSPAASPRTPSSCATEGGSLGQVSRFKEAYASSEPAWPLI